MIKVLKGGLMKIPLAIIILLILCPTLFAQGEADNSTSLTRLGIMKARGGNYEEAIKLLDRAINMDKENTLAYYQRGRAKAGMGNYKDAIADFDITIKLQNDYAPVYVERADAKRKLGDEEGAKKDMDIAVKLDPSYLNMLLLLYIYQDCNLLPQADNISLRQSLFQIVRRLLRVGL